MAQLLFFDETHRYEVNGETLPSVSELCRFLSREIYGDVTQYRLDAAGDRGSGVHKGAELLDKYGKAEISEDLAPYLRAYMAFRREHVCRWEKIEWASWNPAQGYAGTLDRYGTVDGVPTVLDIKTTASIDPAKRSLYTAQLNLYRRLLPPEEPVERLLVLQLRKDETYKLYDLPLEDSLADACLTLHNALKKKRRRRKPVPDRGEGGETNGTESPGA